MSGYPFVQSYVDLGTAKGPRAGIVWHMAEGGGTVGYLAKANPNGVSVHFVVERAGRVVQMLGLNRMHTSIRPSAIRTTNDPTYWWAGADVRYGVTAAKYVLGPWATTATTLGPNHATIGVEVEGYAKDGPNAAQIAGIAQLYVYLLRAYPGIKSLGHRDFASYKACPGHRFPWDKVGGHATLVAPDTSTKEDSPVRPFTIVPTEPVGRLFINEPGVWYEDLKTGVLKGPVSQANWTVGKYPILPVRLDTPLRPNVPNTDDWRLGYVIGDNPAFILKRNVRIVPEVLADTTPYSQAALDDAQEAEYQRILKLIQDNPSQ